MAGAKVPEIDSYASAKRALERAPRSGRIGNNTVIVDGVDGDGIAIRLHNTNIVTYWPDGRIRLDNGGWMSVTTKARMNAVLPAGIGVSQVKGDWVVDIRRGREVETVEFTNGMIISLNEGRRVTRRHRAATADDHDSNCGIHSGRGCTCGQDAYPLVLDNPGDRLPPPPRIPSRREFELGAIVRSADDQRSMTMEHGVYIVKERGKGLIASTRNRQAAVQALNETSARKRVEERYGRNPGKFSSPMDEWMYQLTMDGSSEVLGDVQEVGWHATLLENVEFPEVVAAADSIGDDEHTVRKLWNRDFKGRTSIRGVIVIEDDQGFVGVNYYTRGIEYEAAWRELQEREENDQWHDGDSDDEDEV